MIKKLLLVPLSLAFAVPATAEAKTYRGVGFIAAGANSITCAVEQKGGKLDCIGNFPVYGMLDPMVYLSKNGAALLTQTGGVPWLTPPTAKLKTGDRWQDKNYQCSIGKTKVKCISLKTRRGVNMFRMSEPKQPVKSQAPDQPIAVDENITGV